METKINEARVRELQRAIKTAPSKMERDNARAELRETVREAAQREYLAKVDRFANYFA